MLMKATRLHPGPPQSVMVVWIVTEAVVGIEVAGVVAGTDTTETEAVTDMAFVESVADTVISEVMVDSVGIADAGAEVGNVATIVRFID